MLEIIAVIFLCRANFKRAKLRGKSGGAAIAYTIGLWIGMEIVGILLAVNFLSDASYFYSNIWPVYVLGLGFALVGGVISFYISKRGDVTSFNAEPQTFITPCTVRIFRDASEVLRSSNFYFYLNGEQLDALENDSMLITKTSKSHNIISVRIGEEQFMKDTYQFLASANGVIDIHCAGGKFQPNLTRLVSESPEKEW